MARSKADTVAGKAADQTPRKAPPLTKPQAGKKGQRSISISITAEEIKVCELEMAKSGTITVIQTFTLATPPGCVDDGLVRDINRVSDAITVLLDQHRVGKHKVYFTINSRKIATKEIELPFLKNTALLGDMINANLEEYFPMGNLEDYLTRYTILETFETEGRKTFRIAVYAVLKDLVTSYVELGKALKLPLASIDYQVNSLYHIVQKQNKSGTALMLQIDDEQTHISVLRDQSQLFRRSVPYGMETIVQALAAAQGISESEAAEALRDEAKLDAILDSEALRDLIRDFSSSIVRVVDFYISKNPEVVIEEGRLIGPGSYIAHIEEMMSEVLGIKTKTMEYLAGVAITKVKVNRKAKTPPPDQMTYADLADYLPNIGALIKPLDLKLAEDVAIKKTGIGNGFLVMIAILAAIAAAGASVIFITENIRHEETKRNLEREIASMQSAEDFYRYYLAAGEYMSRLYAYEESTVNDSEALLHLVNTLEEILPEKVRLNDLSITDGKVTFAATSWAGKPGVARFLIELKKQDFIHDIYISNISDTYDEYLNVTSVFNMTFSITIPVEAEIVIGGEETDI
ncbi:MAG: pilus assembly protein PilM [Lachnospiraceae bacterium]|jgi:type IV pilus assembly protein PilM|nr:pilus assembly protein PilM [Lachnospiraceae bacterium]